MAAVSYATTAAVAGALKRSLNAAGRPANVFFAIKYVLYGYDRLAEYPVKFLSSKAMSAPDQYQHYTTTPVTMIC